MAGPAKNKTTNKNSGSRVVTLVILVLVVAAVFGYYMFSPKQKAVVRPQVVEPSYVKPVPSTSSLPQAVVPKPPEVNQIPPDNEQSTYSPTTVIPGHKKPVAAKIGAARLAIIIDDMGNSLSEARSLAAIKVPLTFAIIPGQRVDNEVASYAATNNIETMIHIPMQSKGWPERRLETNGFLVSMAADDLRDRMSGFIRQFPGAVGVNNHMGSEFTEQDEKMSAVLQVLKKNDLFFIDSVTSPESAGLRVAQRLGIRSARRNVFLDNEQERGYIIGQLNQAVKIARKNGSAIAICHPHPATIAALAEVLPGLAANGVTLVAASQLVR